MCFYQLGLKHLTLLMSKLVIFSIVKHKELNHLKENFLGASYHIKHMLISFKCSIKNLGSKACT